MLIITLLTPDNGVTEVILDVYQSSGECNRVIYEERIFNGSCQPINKKDAARGYFLIQG
ncbi:DUF1482 family protein [Lelliottia sp. SL45]|uniref:DUF1482 family protein n=1 Tax=Lelliottia sp. SL45 TaxID=2994665 RepID=UPI0022735100|nr:DUF1482 family protein [Lelliottia sp. SL45]MCY1699709.1 DUF1482 family protein [Lelliottia sp. SL45]